MKIGEQMIKLLYTKVIARFAITGMALAETPKGISMEDGIVDLKLNKTHIYAKSLKRKTTKKCAKCCK
jgi:hypothetical protein